MPTRDDLTRRVIQLEAQLRGERSRTAGLQVGVTHLRDEVQRLRRRSRDKRPRQAAVSAARGPRS